MITRSYCSSWTRSIILQSMQDLRSNPQGAGNPNIPRSCTTLLQSSQSAASGHISVPHTRQPSLSKRCERFRRVPCREGRCCHFLLGENPTHSPNKKHIGSRFRVRNGIDNSNEKNSNHSKPNWASWGKQKIDWHRKLSWKSKWKRNLDFHFKRFEVSGTHLFISTLMWPRQTEVILKLNVLRNSHFLYLEIPIKRGSCLSVSYYIFSFHPDWFLGDCVPL